MDKYTVIEIEGDKKLLNRYKTFQIKKKNNTLMNDEDAQILYDHYNIEDKRMLILALRPESRWTTLKSLDDTNLNVKDTDYWKNKVEDPEKFMMYDVIQISYFEHKKKLAQPTNLIPKKSK